MQTFVNNLLVKAMLAKAKVESYLKNENGETNIIAIILILAIVIALAIVFRKQLTALFDKIWNSLFANVDNVL